MGGKWSDTARERLRDKRAASFAALAAGTHRTYEEDMAHYRTENARIASFYVGQRVVFHDGTVAGEVKTLGDYGWTMMVLADGAKSPESWYRGWWKAVQH